MTYRRLIVFIVAALALVLIACQSAVYEPQVGSAVSQDDPATPTPETETDNPDDDLPTIADVVAANPQFSVLITALEAAGLDEVLAEPGEFTVFAPPDAAFNDLPEETLDGLLADPQGALTEVLLYHVISGTVSAEQVVAAETLTTLQGESITVTVNDAGSVILNDAVTVSQVDRLTANGIIHVVDGVLVPPSAVAEMGDEDVEPAPEEDDTDDNGGLSDLFVNGGEGGLVTITGLVTHTNPFFGAGTAQPLVILEDQAGFVDRDRGYIFPVESQVLGQITTDFRESPFTYSMVLPIEPRGAFRDVDNDDQTEEGVQVFAVAYWENTYGGPFLEERDLSGGGWSTNYASTEISDNPVDEGEIVGGKLVVYAPDDSQSFPINFGEDGELFTEDDQEMVDLPAGYTVVDLDTVPFTFNRARNQSVPLLEAASAALRDFSPQTYTEAFQSLVDELQERYAFTDVKNIDWEALEEEYLPRFETADEEEDSLAYQRALRDFLWEIPDGHISGPTVIEDFQQAVSGGIGMGVRELDDGRIIVNYLTEGAPAAEAGFDLGTEIVSLQGITATNFVSDAVAYSAPFSTDHVERLQQLRYATRFPLGTEVEVGYINGDGEPMTTTLETVPEFDSFSLSSFFTGRTGLELPVEFEILDSGYGYIEITGFLDNQLLTIQLWERAMRQFNEQQVPGVIVDMRQNGGGFGFTADQMAAYFFDENQIVGYSAPYDEEADTFIISADRPRRMYVPDEELRYSGEVAVLVGPACASACEFFTYDMTINDRADIVGHYPTAGLGGSITDLNMPDDVTVRYTIGRALGVEQTIHIEGQGIAPTVRVPVTEETLFYDGDPVLDRAVALLEGELAFDPPVVSPLELNVPVTNSLTITATDFYTVAVTEGQVINILVEAADQDQLDPVVRLYAEDGTQLLENDDLTNKSLDAGFDELDIPFDLILYIEVDSYDEEKAAGVYTLTVSSAEPVEDNGPAPPEEDIDEDDAESEEGASGEDAGEGETEDGAADEGTTDESTDEDTSDEGESGGDGTDDEGSDDESGGDGDG